MLDRGSRSVFFAFPSVTLVDFRSVSAEEVPSFGTRTARGGDDGIRTHDPLLAGQVLSQLSYTPVCLYPSSSLFK